MRRFLHQFIKLIIRLWWCHQIGFKGINVGFVKLKQLLIKHKIFNAKSQIISVGSGQTHLK